MTELNYSTERGVHGMLPVRLMPCVECCCLIPECDLVCSECGGEAARDTAPCPDCSGGTVRVAEPVRTAYGPRVAPDSPEYTAECSTCGGWGEIEPPYVLERDRAGGQFLEVAS